MRADDRLEIVRNAFELSKLDWRNVLGGIPVMVRARRPSNFPPQYRDAAAIIHATEGDGEEFARTAFLLVDNEANCPVHGVNARPNRRATMLAEVAAGVSLRGDAAFHVFYESDSELQQILEIFERF
jgi:hypothetical protein